MQLSTIFQLYHKKKHGGRCGHDRMVVGFLTTYAIKAYQYLSCEAIVEVYSMQHYVIKFVSDL